MAKLSVEQRAKIRTWLREQLPSDPDRTRDGRKATEALGFEVTDIQVQAAYRDILALSEMNKRRVQKWLAENWGKSPVEGVELEWRSPDDGSSDLLTKLLGTIVTEEHIEDARAAIGKEWHKRATLQAMTHWVHPEHEDHYDYWHGSVSTWTDVPHPVANLTVIEGSDAESLRSFLRSMLEKVDELVAGANAIDDEVPFPGPNV